MLNQPTIWKRGGQRIVTLVWYHIQTINLKWNIEMHVNSTQHGSQLIQMGSKEITHSLHVRGIRDPSAQEVNISWEPGQKREWEMEPRKSKVGHKRIWYLIWCSQQTYELDTLISPILPVHQGDTLEPGYTTANLWSQDLKAGQFDCTAY